MSKLKNVKTIDMVNGEITKVAYDGAEYVKTEGDAKVGDLIRRDTDDHSRITAGGLYKILGVDSDGDVRIENDRGDNEQWFIKRNGTLFSKISDTSPTIEERVTALESDVAALKSGEKANETIEFEDAEYRKVDREAREGDVVIFRENTSCCVINDKLYKVIRSDDGPYPAVYDGGKFRVYFEGYGRTRETVDVYAPIAKSEPIEQAKYVPQEGDIVVVTANESGSRNSVGDIGKVVGEHPDSFQVDVPQKPDGPDVNGNWHSSDEVRKATPVEVEQYEKALHKASFDVGDYVKIVKSYRNLEGNIAKITQIGKFRGDYGVADFEIEHLTGEYAGKTLVADAEQIVKATDAEIAKATAPKLKAGDFVKFKQDGTDITVGKAYELFEDFRGIYFVDDAEDPRWHHFDHEYEIVDAETAKWAQIGRKVGEFKKGDVVRIVEGMGSGFAKGTLGVVARDGIEADFAPKVTAYATDEQKVTTYWAKVEIVATVETTLN